MKNPIVTFFIGLAAGMAVVKGFEFFLNSTTNPNPPKNVLPPQPPDHTPPPPVKKDVTPPPPKVQSNQQ